MSMKTRINKLEEAVKARDRKLFFYYEGQEPPKEAGPDDIICRVIYVDESQDPDFPQDTSPKPLSNPEK